MAEKPTSSNAGVEKDLADTNADTILGKGSGLGATEPDFGEGLGMDEVGPEPLKKEKPKRKSKAGVKVKVGDGEVDDFSLPAEYVIDKEGSKWKFNVPKGQSGKVSEEIEKLKKELQESVASGQDYGDIESKLGNLPEVIRYQVGEFLKEVVGKSQEKKRIKEEKAELRRVKAKVKKGFDSAEVEETTSSGGVIEEFTDAFSQMDEVAKIGGKYGSNEADDSKDSGLKKLAGKVATPFKWGLNLVKGAVIIGYKAAWRVGPFGAFGKSGTEVDQITNKVKDELLEKGGGEISGLAEKEQLKEDEIKNRSFDLFNKKEPEDLAERKERMLNLAEVLDELSGPHTPEAVKDRGELNSLFVQQNRIHSKLRELRLEVRDKIGLFGLVKTVFNQEARNRFKNIAAEYGSLKIELNKFEEVLGEKMIAYKEKYKIVKKESSIEGKMEKNVVGSPETGEWVEGEDGARVFRKKGEK